MIKPILWKLAGLGLVFYAALDFYKLGHGWYFHAFYTGLGLFLAGQALGLLRAIFAASAAVERQIAQGPFMEHIGQIRSLLDAIRNEARDRKPDTEQVKQILDALVAETRKRNGEPRAEGDGRPSSRRAYTMRSIDLGRPGEHE